LFCDQKNNQPSLQLSFFHFNQGPKSSSSPPHIPLFINMLVFKPSPKYLLEALYIAIPVGFYAFLMSAMSVKEFKVAISAIAFCPSFFMLSVTIDTTRLPESLGGVFCGLFVVSHVPLIISLCFMPYLDYIFGMISTASYLETASNLFQYAIFVSFFNCVMTKFVFETSMRMSRDISGAILSFVSFVSFVCHVFLF
jgi:hypothetical protein